MVCFCVGCLLMVDVCVSVVLEGCLLIFLDEWLFKLCGMLFVMCIVFGVVIWIFMIGVGLLVFGDVCFIIFGYIIGLMIGYVFVMFGVGLLSFCYGIDVMDVVKVSFGMCGVVILLLGLFGVVFVWFVVVMCFIVWGIVMVVWVMLLLEIFVGENSYWLIVGVVLIVVVVIWVFVRCGFVFMECINNVVGFGLFIVVMIFFILLGNCIGWDYIWIGCVLVSGWIFLDCSFVFILVVEFGMGVLLGFWLFVVGFICFVKNWVYVVILLMLGVLMIGGGYGVGVVVLVVNVFFLIDLVMWFLDFGGMMWGGVVVIVVFIGNVVVIGLLIYFVVVVV